MLIFLVFFNLCYYFFIYNCAWCTPTVPLWYVNEYLLECFITYCTRVFTYTIFNFTRYCVLESLTMTKTVYKRAIIIIKLKIFVAMQILWQY